MNDVMLSGERVRLRALKREDARMVAGHHNDQDVVQMGVLRDEYERR